jgi:hypothetical protein
MAGARLACRIKVTPREWQLPGVVDDLLEETDMIERTCSVDGCVKAHRAKGYCVTHYNQQLPQRHRKKPMPCDYCGELLLKDTRSSRANRYCDYTCRVLHSFDMPGYYDQSGRPPLSRTQCLIPDDHPARWYGSTCAVKYGHCADCLAVIISRGGRKYCSKQCRARSVARLHMQTRAVRRKARKVDVFVRDGWICWICDKATSAKYDCNDPWSPTIDHLVPVSLGGQSDAQNLATAHMICNSMRGATLNLT